MGLSFDNNTVRFSLVLTVVCSIAAMLLYFVNEVTRVKIEENNRIEMQNKRIEVMPDSVKFEEKLVLGHKYHIAYDASGKEIGVTFQVVTRGYGGPIHVTMGINNDILSGIAISRLDQHETPGLGIKITTFRNKKISQIALSKKGGEIDAVTAASISSQAVVTGVVKGFKQYEADKEEIFDKL